MLVVSGHKAQFRGTGKVNGETGYKFVLTATTATSPAAAARTSSGSRSRSPTGVIVYDTGGVVRGHGPADPTAIGGGSIVIHKGK